MKINLCAFLSVIILVFMAEANSTHHSDRPSVHGMLMVGTERIYLSHLPMFHSPHDYQAIFEVQIDNRAHAEYLESLSHSTEKVYTLVPEVFVLPEMVRNPRSFSADIFKGHFERGGSIVVENVRFEITKVLYFRKFKPGDVHPPHAIYLLFGNQEEQFLAHLITAAPDFDQISQVSVPESVLGPLQAKDVLAVEFKKRPHALPLTEGNLIQGISRGFQIGTAHV